MTDEWSQLEPVEVTQEDAGDWGQLEPIETASTQAPIPDAKEEGGFSTQAESAWNNLKNLSAGEVIVGAAENVLTAATAVPGMIAGGIAGLNAATTAPASDGGFESIDRENFESGKPTFRNKPDASEAVASTQDAMTYGPRSEVGQQVQEFIGDKFEKASQYAQDVAYNAGHPTEHVAGATAAYTALMFLPYVIGRGFFKKGGKSPSKAPSRQTLRQNADDLYKRADQSGAAVTAESYNGVIARIEQRLAKEGFDLSLHPDTAAALANLKGKAGNNQTLMGVEINRKVINGARGATKPADARMASIVMDTYDDWMRGFTNKDMLMGDPKSAAIYAEARGLWSRKMKSDEIEWAIERAAIRADANYSGAAFETALKQEFAAILKNKKRRRMFDENELAVIRAVTKGTLPQNFLRLLGKVAPRGVVSGAPGAALMTIEPTLGAATWLVGEGAKRAATRMTSKQATKAAETMRLPST